MNKKKKLRNIETSGLFIYCLVSSRVHKIRLGRAVNIDLVTVLEAILMSRQMCEKLQCLYENLMSNNFRKTAVLKKIYHF